MASNDSVQLSDGEEGELVELRADGTKRSYYPRRQNINFICTELRVGQSFARRADGDVSAPTMEWRVGGIAWLDGDDGLSVIGDPMNKTRRVEVLFKPDDRSNLLEPHPSDPRSSFGQPNGRATLGFVRADWEIGSSDTWFVECYANSAALKPLVEAVCANTVKKVSFSVRLAELYCDEPPFVPYDSAELFLRPEKGSNRLKHPELANGFLDELRLDFAAIDLSPGDEAAVEDQISADAAPPIEAAADPLLVALELLAARTEAMRDTLKWIGGFIVGGLLLIACKV